MHDACYQQARSCSPWAQFIFVVPLYTHTEWVQIRSVTSYTSFTLAEMYKVQGNSHSGPFSHSWCGTGSRNSFCCRVKVSTLVGAMVQTYRDLKTAYNAEQILICIGCIYTNEHRSSRVVPSCWLRREPEELLLAQSDPAPCPVKGH